jgi:hypothetical protein
MPQGEGDEGQESEIRVLSDIASTMKHYQNRKRSISKISSQVLHSQVRRSIMPGVISPLIMEESSSSTDSEANDKSPSTLQGRRYTNKSALATTGINGTRNLIKSLI